MSAEFFTEYNDSTIGAAVGNMETTMRRFRYVAEYAREIEDIYSELPYGQTELEHMIRAAQCVVNHQSDEPSEEVRSVYYGELLGLEFINYLQPDNGDNFKIGIAESYLQIKLGLHRLTNNGTETEAAQLVQFSESIKSELSQPMIEHGLNPIYEEFGTKATSNLTDDVAHQELAMMGFRLIVTEALKPTLKPKLVGEILSRFDDDYIPTIKEMEELLGDEEVLQTVEWEDIAYIPKVLFARYNQIKELDEEQQLSNLAILASMDRYTENRLMEFNMEHQLILPNDLISVDGDMFAVAAGDIPLLHFKDIEIRGIFGGIHMLRVPTEAHMLRMVLGGDDDETVEKKYREDPALQETPAIRILSPMYVVTNVDDKSFSESSDNEWIDIPLNYENISYMRIAADELEAEA